jgi:hypothetical protein
VAQRPQSAGQVGKLEGVPAEHVDVVSYERGQSGDVLIVDVEAVHAKLVHCGAVRERDHGPSINPQHSHKPPLTRENVKVLLEY